jgi:hypothetical protein
MDYLMGRPKEFFPTHGCDGTHSVAEIGLYNMNWQTIGLVWMMYLLWIYNVQ